MSFPPNIEDDRTFADLVGDDQERRWRVDGALHCVTVHLVVHDLTEENYLFFRKIFLFCWFCWIDYNDAHPLTFQHAVCSESFEEKNESIDKEKNEQKTFRMFLKYVCDDVVSMMHYT